MYSGVPSRLPKMAPEKNAPTDRQRNNPADHPAFNVGESIAVPGIYAKACAVGDSWSGARRARQPGISDTPSSILPHQRERKETPCASEQSPFPERGRVREGVKEVKAGGQKDGKEHEPTAHPTLILTPGHRADRGRLRRVNLVVRKKSRSPLLRRRESDRQAKSPGVHVFLREQCAHAPPPPCGPPQVPRPRWGGGFRGTCSILAYPVYTHTH